MTDCAFLPSTCDANYHEEATPPNLPNTDPAVQTDYHPVETESTKGAGEPVESNGDYNLEVPLRRSKRGKGKGANSTASATAAGGANTGATNGSGGGAAEERVSSCLVNGTEYQTGNFVYYEEPDFEYFTIGLIEEIKFSRRDKFAITVKCFYRTHDIPESSKQCILERELFHSPSNSLRKAEVLSRELFVSEVQETIASKQLRGRCKVSHLQDLRTALNTFSPDEEDCFFYVFAYNPETRRLMHTRAEIRVGHAFQANIPRFRHLPPATYHPHPHKLRCGRSCRFLHSTHGHYPRRSKLPRVPPGGLLDESKPELDERTHSPIAAASVTEAPHSMEECISQKQPQTIEEQCKLEDADLDTDVPKSPPALENFSSVRPREDSPSLAHLHSHRHTVAESSVRKLLSRRRRARRFETLTWRPHGLAKRLSAANNLKASEVNHLFNGDIMDEPLKTYLDAVRSMVAFFGFGGADDDLSSAENGLTLANLAATTQHAYDTLHKSGYSLKHALQSISYNPIASKASGALYSFPALFNEYSYTGAYLANSSLSSDTPRHWTADQVRLFAYALRVHGKDFFAIQRDFFGGRASAIAATPSTQLGHPGTGNTPLSGRLRGRGRRRAGVSGASCNHKVKTDEEEMMDLKTEDHPQAGEESDQGLSNDATGDNKPVKTVKELIAFYYYWKRKGAASAASPSMLVTTNHQGGLTGAAVNFAAAVACANADGQSVLGNGASLSGVVSQISSHQPQQLQQQQQPLAGVGGKRRKPTTSRGNAPRASTPASELSESACASLPDSETDGPPEACKRPFCINSGPTFFLINAPFVDETSDYNVIAKDDKDSLFEVTSNKLAGAEQDLPPSGRLRRRLCRNCAKELPSPTDTLQPTGVGQLRFLCHACRNHLQKYGELKSTSLAAYPPPQLHSEVSHPPSSCVETTDEGKPSIDHTATDDPTHGSPVSPIASPVSCSRHSWNPDAQTSSLYSSTYSLCHSSPCSTALDSEDYFSSSSSLESDCSSPSSGSRASSDTGPETVGKNIEGRTLRKRSKRPRYENYPHASIHSKMPCVTHPEVKESNEVANAGVCGAATPLVTKTSPSWPPANSTTGEESHTSPLQVTITASQWSLPDTKKQLSGFTADNNASHSPKVEVRARSSPMHHEVEGDDAGDAESETEVELMAHVSSLTPCLRQIHRSTWSRLVRIWDRSVTIRVPTDTNRTLFNAGSCSRTDVIYDGRGLTEEELAVARHELYSCHLETAVGPGALTIGSGGKTDAAAEPSKHQVPLSATASRRKFFLVDTDGPIKWLVSDSACELSSAAILSQFPLESSRPSESHGSVSCPFAISNSGVHDSSALNLSARTLHSSPTQRLAPPCSRASSYDGSALLGQQHSSVQSSAASSFKNPSTYLPAARTSTTPNQPSGNNVTPAPYDPSPTQQQIQAAYEQAMLLAAAATQHHYQQAKLTGQQSREAHQQSHRQFVASTSAHSPRPSSTHTSNAKVSAAQLSARLGAAAGTFYPPALVASTLNLVSPTGGRPITAGHVSSQSFPPTFLSPTLLNSLGAGAHVHTPSYPSFVNPAVSTPGEALWKNHDALQLQLTMMGLLPPATLPDPALLYGSVDPRETEAFRLLMAEKLTHLRYPSANLPANDQQDFLTTATEMLLRARANLGAGGGTFGDSSNGHTNPLLYPPPPVTNTGAMTSAVNSISTRPTASVQSPHYRHSSGSHASTLAASTSSAHSRLPTSTTIANSSVSSASFSRQSSSISAAQQLQEQMFNAAKLAMLAANMQSDPSKAFTFAAALAELAAHEKTQSQLTVTPSHLGTQPSKPIGMSLPPFDMRIPATGAGNSSSTGAHPDRLGSASPFRRRPSGPFGGITSGSPSPSLLPSQTACGLPPISRPLVGAPTNQSRMMSSPTVTTPSNRFSTATPLLIPNMTPNFASVFNPGHIPSPSQLAQLSQLTHSAGLAPGLGLQDPAMMNALALAAAAAYAAGPQLPDFTAVGDSDHGDRHRYPGQIGSSVSRHPTFHQQQQQAAAAAFAALPQFNIGGHRLPSSHR
ncbi:hypothetical protein T265_11014 [Opisthorchis viverrini]|uniref:BAH domain protein n=1 Tax=Opisthorchis viverrini TaxID=6198 RepID=A0A074Z4H7_OPIVI|nr:hypothetical protein T265_11014 [Opisthorchis viverrini]KER20432.1 hypothetical protein T265_11014 [Opisthorchis viverrini]